MKVFFYLIIPKVLAALPFSEKKPEEYEIKDVEKLLGYFAKLFFATLIPVAIIVIIWGAYQYLTAYGNEEKAQRGKTIILWAIVGLVVATLAQVIVYEVEKILGM